MFRMWSVFRHARRTGFLLAVDTNRTLNNNSNHLVLANFGALRCYAASSVDKNACRMPRKPCPDDDKDCTIRPPVSNAVCSKPNLMSECPTPTCPYDDGDKKPPPRNNLLWTLLAAAATVAALWFFMGMRKQEEPPKVKKKSNVVVTESKIEKPVPLRRPCTAKDIPNEIPYLLIGGGTAAFSAFRAIKSNDPTAKVLVISKEEAFPYMRPPLSKELWYNDDVEQVRKLIFKQWNGSERSLFYEPKDFYLRTKDLMHSEKGGVAVARGWTVKSIDVFNRIAYLDDGCEIKYEKCLIATGSSPKSLDLIEAAEPKVIEKVINFQTINDFQCLQGKLKNAKSVAIIGGSFLGSELACAIAHKTKSDEEFKVYQIFKESGNLSGVLPEFLCTWTTDRIKEQGVEVLNNTAVVGAFATENNTVLLNLNNGKSIETDLVVLCVGAYPNTQLAATSNLELDPEDGGFVVNTELQARSNLYVAGDVASFYDPHLGRRRNAHHDNAVISGRLAGENMTGASKPYKHQSMFWSDLGPDLGFEAIGLINPCLPTVSVFVKKAPPPPPVVEEEKDCTRYETKEQLEEAIKREEECRKIREEEEKQKAKEVPLTVKDCSDRSSDFSKGVIFYLRDDIVVGIVLWNIFNRMSVARQVIKDQRKYDDLNEVAKLFNIHDD